MTALRWGAVALSIAAFAWAGAHVIALATHWSQVEPLIGVDYRILTAAAERWLQGDGFYLAYQLAGPYDIDAMNAAGSAPIMYPPTALLLLAPFTVLPAILWWAIPITVTAWVVWHHRPRWPVWPALAFLVAFPTTLSAIETGNPTLWFTMALALGTVYGWPAVLLILKPTIAPLALIGITHRSWWVALAGLAAASLLFLPMWADYLAVLSNTGSSLGVFYSLNQYPTLFIPIIAWLGSSATPALPDLGRVVRALRSPRGGRLEMSWARP
jgi:hypothetical protein